MRSATPLVLHDVLNVCERAHADEWPRRRHRWPRQRSVAEPHNSGRIPAGQEYKGFGKMRNSTHHVDDPLSRNAAVYMQDDAAEVPGHGRSG